MYKDIGVSWEAFGAESQSGIFDGSIVGTIYDFRLNTSHPGDTSDVSTLLGPFDV